MFTVEQEDVLIGPIETEFLHIYLLFAHHKFRILAVQKDYQWNPTDADAPVLAAHDFHRSNGSVFDFKSTAISTTAEFILDAKTNGTRRSMQCHNLG
jgi:hypothetical protein